jgi:hypothetical protein
MDTHKKIREHISTLCDGALSDSDLELAVAALQSADGQQAWDTYFHIGDALRNQTVPELSASFRDDLAARLDLENVPLARPSRSRSPFGDLIGALQLGMAADMGQTARDLLDQLTFFSTHFPDREMVRLAVRARDVLAICKGKGQLSGTPQLAAMLICAKHWKRLHPRIASTGLAAREMAVITSYRLAATPLALRAASERAGAVAWLYEVSALLGEDVTNTLARHPQRVPGTGYHAVYAATTLQYLECGASYNVNQFIRIALPEPGAPPMVITGECKGGDSAFGAVRGPRSFTQVQGAADGVISQRDKLYPLSRAFYMARASTKVPAGQERKLAGKAIEQAALDGLMVYLIVRGKFDVGQQAISSEIEVFI